MASLFRGVFGSAPPPKPSNQILSSDLDVGAVLDRRLKDLEKLVKQCDSQIDKARADARERVTRGDRDGAGRFLKQLKMAENKRKDFYAFMYNVQAMSDQLRYVFQLKEQAQAMSAVAQATKRATQEIDKDKLENMMEEMGEVLEDVSDVSNMLREQLVVPGMISDDETNAEVDKLMAEMMAETAPAPAVAAAPMYVPVIPSGLPSAVPSIPSGMPQPARQSDMMDELGALEG